MTEKAKTKKGRTYVAMNKETGEKKEFYVGEKKISFDRRYNVIFQESYKKLICNKELTGADFRVASYLIAELDYQNRLWHIRQKEIASELGLTKEQVSRSIAKLMKLRFVERSETGLMSVSMEYVWRGSAGEYKKIMKENDAKSKAERDKNEVEEEQITPCVSRAA